MRGEKIVRTADDEETKGPAGSGGSRRRQGCVRRGRSPGTGGLEPYPQT